VLLLVKCLRLFDSRARKNQHADESPTFDEASYSNPQSRNIVATTRIKARSELQSTVAAFA
jgi:hypothetical protein